MLRGKNLKERKEQIGTPSEEASIPSLIFLLSFPKARASVSFASANAFLLMALTSSSVDGANADRRPTGRYPTLVLNLDTREKDCFLRVNH